MKLKVLIVQNSAIIGNKEATFKNVDTLLSNYKDKRPDIIVFPEVWSIGWDCKIFKDNAEEIQNSETIKYLSDIAQEFSSLVIGGSFIQKINNEYKNTCPIISPKGKLITTYDKMHLFSHKGSEENNYIKAGNNLKILDMGKYKIGLSICYDIRFPELFRTYSLNGVDIFVNMAAWSNKKPEHWQIMHKARAIENQCFMIVADQTGKISQNEYNLGHSMVINPWGETECSLEEEEDCLYCEIDINKVKKLREDFPLLKDRRDSNTFEIEEIKVND